MRKVLGSFVVSEAQVSAYGLALALVLDVTVGEYPSAVHPVVWMGTVTKLLERLAPRTSNGAALVYGGVVALLVPSLFAAGAFFLLRASAEWPLVHVVLTGVVLKSTFAVKGLGGAAARTARALRASDLDGARESLRSLCSRDPSRLRAEQLVAAAIESVAENTSDSFVGPMFYFVLFGVPGAVAYRAVNTLDAMIGYHGRYEYLGKASAKLDDLLNLAPARLTAFFLLLASPMAGADGSSGVRVWWRDADRTESPNAGQPMAMMAGLLRVSLEKEGHYRLGDPRAPLTPSAIERAVVIMALAALLCAATTLALVRAGRADPF